MYDIYLLLLGFLTLSSFKNTTAKEKESKESSHTTVHLKIGDLNGLWKSACIKTNKKSSGIFEQEYYVKDGKPSFEYRGYLYSKEGCKKENEILYVKTFGTYSLEDAEIHTAKINHKNIYIKIKTNSKKITADVEKYCKVKKLPLNKNLKIFLKDHDCKGHPFIGKTEAEEIHMDDHGIILTHKTKGGAPIKLKHIIEH